MLSFLRLGIRGAKIIKSEISLEDFFEGALSPSQASLLKPGCFSFIKM